MRQKLIGFLSAVSIVLFGTVIIFLVVPQPQQEGMVLLHGIPLIYRNATATLEFQREQSIVTLNVPLPDPIVCPEKSDGLIQLRWLASIPSGTESSALGFDLRRNNPEFGMVGNVPAVIGHWSDLTIRFWHLLILFSILPLRTAALSWRRRRRERKKEAGLCVRCGYDLRASTGRCPECGEVIEAQAQIAKA